MRKHTRIDKPFIEDFADDFKRQARNKLFKKLMTSGKSCRWISEMMELVQTCYSGELPEDAEIEITEDRK